MMNPEKSDRGENNFINVYVCGRFHYHHYVRFLRGSLKKVYFSHRLSEDLGLPSPQRVNIFIKEYLIAAHLRLMGRIALDRAALFYQSFWKLGLMLFSDPAEVNLVMLHGNCVPVIRRAKRAGKMVVGEAVNMHPTALNDLLMKEAGCLGQPVRDYVLGKKGKLEEIRMLDYLLCPSESVKRSYVENGFDESRIFVLPYGTASAIAPRHRVRQKHGNELRVICVGQLSVRKGQVHVLSAVKQLRCDGKCVDLLLVGMADPDYLDLLRSTGVDFRHVHHVEHQQLKLMIADSDVLVLPSLEDGFGMVVTEAMEMGTPAVVSPYAGASEVVREVGGGLVADPFDCDKFSEAILKAVEGDFPMLRKSPDTWGDYARKLESLLFELRPLGIN